MREEAMNPRLLSIKVFYIFLAGWNASILSLNATAQSVQVSPEADVYVSFNQRTRLWFQAGSVYEG